MSIHAERLYTAEQSRRLDQSAIVAHGIPGIELMERAGYSVFEAVLSRFPTPGRMLVVCGGGNNGGDGYIVARLARQQGWEVGVCALSAPERLTGDAALAAQLWHNAGGKTVSWPAMQPAACDVIIDALLGTGLDRAPEGDFAAAIERINSSGRPVVAVDIPSGLNADSGNVMGQALRADMTVTFIGQKRGLFTADGPDYSGAVRFADLGTPGSVQDSVQGHGLLVRQDFIGRVLQPRARNSHKGSFGWVLGIGGNSSMSGAVRLCGEAALRSGAGKVTVATIPEHAALINLTCPELMVRGVKQGKQLEQLLAQVDAIVIGTGLGQTAWAEDLFHTCMQTHVPLLLDADGLNILARLHPAREDRARLPRGRWVLTPHPAEAGRLLGCTAGEVQSDRVGAAQRLAHEFDAVVVLKGCGSIIADASGRYAICPLGNPGMASAGTGDVLAGVIGALIAQGLGTWDAAAAGVVAHAAAGDLAAAQNGERGLIASDITRLLPRVLNPAQALQREVAHDE